MERLVQILDELEDLRVWVALRGARLRGLALALTIAAVPAALVVNPALWPAVSVVLLLGLAAARAQRVDDR